MKILVFTRSEWDDSNGIGNTMSNLFGGIDKGNLANFYVRSALPNNNICNYYYSVSDKEIIEHFISKNSTPGKSFVYDIAKNANKNNHTDVGFEKKIYGLFKFKNSILGLIFQNFIWSKRFWENEKLDKFLEDYNPDVIFSPSFHTIYTHEILWYLKNKTGAKLVLFHADDYLNPHNLSGPLEKRYFKKRKEAITKSVNLSSINYCISHKQQEEYSDKFKTEMKLLYKGGNFDIKPQYNIDYEKSIKLVYLGSLLHGRWKTLAALAKSIDKVNKEGGIQFRLDIYSQYQPTDKILTKIEVNNASKFNGKVESSKVMNILEKSDVVLHIESFEEKEKAQTRLSFSTKIVDCLRSGKPLIAIGDKEAASIDYLHKNDAALIASNYEQISDTLTRIKNNIDILNEFSDKSWNFGKENHQLETIRSNFYSDLRDLIKDGDLSESPTD